MLGYGHTDMTKSCFKLFRTPSMLGGADGAPMWGKENTGRVLLKIGAGNRSDPKREVLDKVVLGSQREETLELTILILQQAKTNPEQRAPWQPDHLAPTCISMSFREK